MGIKDYLKHLKQEEIFDIIEYDHVYIDCNYLIHFLIYKCTNDKELYGKMCNFWNNLMKAVKIKSTVYLIYDGEHENEELMANPKLQTLILRYKDKEVSDDYDKQVIKPGSKILNTFKYYLVDIIEKYKKINKLKFSVIENDDQIKGEADIKILNSIYNSNQDNICICSKDSDMILIAHSLSINKSIRIDVITNFRPMLIVYINNFKKFNLDYILIVLLLGNDYLPKISSISYDAIIKTYEEYIKFNELIISNGIIDTNNLIEFITYFIIIGSKKKIKFNYKNLDLDRFRIYINNLFWCLKHYKVVSNDLNYIQEISHHEDDIKLKNTLHIHNFINHLYV
jgi:hypothetical protein